MNKEQLINQEVYYGNLTAILYKGEGIRMEVKIENIPVHGGRMLPEEKHYEELYRLIEPLEDIGWKFDHLRFRWGK